MEENNNKIETHFDIIITKGYINTYEHFVNKLKDQYKIDDHSKDITNVSSIVIIKNYLSAIEAHKILQSFSSLSLSSIQKLNL